MPRLGRDLYPLRGCVQWNIKYWKDRALSRVDPTRQESLTLKNEIQRAKLQEATGHLVPRADVMRVWSGATLRLASWLDSFPGSIGREMGWSHPQIKTIRERLDEARIEFVTECAEYLEAEIVDDIDKKAG